MALLVAEAIRESGGESLTIRMDATIEKDWQDAISLILTEWKHLDICVNCAGIAYAKPINELSLADWRRVMATNLDSVFLGTQHAMNAMKKGEGGCIINIASAAGIKPIAGNAAYGTSKAAIRYFTRVAAIEGATHNVRVVSISPGAVATPMWASTEMWPKQIAEMSGQEAALKALVQDRGFAEPGEIAAAVIFLASKEGRHVVGADLPMDDGFSIS
jgi:NAD(P)-dependent dehydrogenase (short-subunit alcohol dehydrogenase family)